MVIAQQTAQTRERLSVEPALGDWTLIVAVNDPQVLKANLLRSPDIDGHCQIIRKDNFKSAAQAYNAAIEQAKAEILVFCHSDVYLPESWITRVRAAIQDLDSANVNWGVLGVIGVDPGRTVVGQVYSSGLGKVVGTRLVKPQPVTSLDEMVLVMRRSSGLRFDEQLPGFHLYGTDICFEAARRGFLSYAIPAFCVHNSNGIKFLPAAFWSAYEYMRLKWAEDLPITTCCTTISRRGYARGKHVLSRFRTHVIHGARVGARCSDPEPLYRRLVCDGSVDAY